MLPLKLYAFDTASGVAPYADSPAEGQHLRERRRDALQNHP